MVVGGNPLPVYPLPGHWLCEKDGLVHGLIQKIQVITRVSRGRGGVRGSGSERALRTDGDVRPGWGAILSESRFEVAQIRGDSLF